MPLNLRLKISYADRGDLENSALIIQSAPGSSDAQSRGAFSPMARCLAIENQLLLAQSDQDQERPASAGPTDGSAIRVLRCQSKEPEDQLTAYAWVVELAEATWHLLYEFAKRYELGYFAQPSDDLDARDGQP